MEIELTTEFLRHNAIKKYRIIEQQNPLVRELIKQLNLQIDYAEESKQVEKNIKNQIAAGTIKLPN